MVVVPFAVAYGLATVLAVLVTWQAFRVRSRQSAPWLAATMAGVSWWSLMKFLEAMLFEQPLRYLFTAFHWIGVGVVSIGVLGFGLSLTGRTTWLTSHRIALLSILPVIPVVAWLGDPRVAGLLATGTPLSATLVAPFEAVEANWSWLRWVSIAYLWLLVAAGSLFVLETALERPRLDPSRGLLGVMVAVPWAINISYEVGVIPYTGFDPTVLGFVVTGIAGLAAIDRFRLFDVPFARSQLVEQFSTAVLVYGRDQRLYDYNEQAARLLELDADDLDRDIRRVLADTPIPVPDSDADGAGDQAVADALDGIDVAISQEDTDSRRFLVQVTALGDDRTQDIGHTLQLTDITDEYQQREQIQRERNLKELIRSVLVQLSSQDELEQAFCAHLATEERYSFVGICERSSDGELTARTFASGATGDSDLTGEGYDEIEIPAEPGLSALETGTPIIERGVSSATGDESTALFSAVDASAVAAFPITHNGLTYGVLVVCSPWSDTFDAEEEQLLTELSESVAFSIAVAEQREALRGELVREVVFEVSDPDHHLLSIAPEAANRNTTPMIDVYEVTNDSDTGVASGPDTTESEAEGLLQFLHVEGMAGETVVSQLRTHPEVQATTVLVDDEETASIRVLVRQPSIGSRLADVGGVVRSINVTGEVITVVAEFSTGTDMNRVLGHLREEYPGTTVLSMVTKKPEPVNPERDRLASLTLKQQQALEAAYHSGFFDRPQRQTADEIAAELGVSRATFLRHVRAAEAKVIETALDDHD